MVLPTNGSKDGAQRYAGNRCMIVALLLAPFAVLTILGVLFASRSNRSVPADNLASSSSLASSVPTAKLVDTPAPFTEPQPIPAPKLTPKPIATSTKPTQPPIQPTGSPVQTTSAPVITTQTTSAPVITTQTTSAPVITTQTTSAPVITIPIVWNPTTAATFTGSFALPPVVPVPPLGGTMQPTSSPIGPLAKTTQPTSSLTLGASKRPTSSPVIGTIPATTNSPVSSLATNVMPSVFNFLSLRPTGTATHSPTKAPVPPSNFDQSQSFRLKMYWEPHYFWQEEEQETWWCIACTECTELNFGAQGENCRPVDWCQAGDQIWLQPCKRKDINNGEPFTFVDLGDYSQIKVSGTDLCLQRTLTRYVTVERCDNPRFVRTRQLWYGMRDDGLPFEIRPGEESRDTEAFCLTQQHHPKNYEIVALKECQWAHYYDTGLWIQYPLKNN